MFRLNLKPGLMIIPLLVAVLVTAAPVAAKGPTKAVVELPFICTPADSATTVQVMIDIDSAYVHQAANWTSPFP